MSVNDGLGGKAPSETQLTQTWSTIEKEHVHSHFRKHSKYWDKHPRKAAESCVRNWRQFFPDEADKLPVDKVVEYGEFVRKTGKLAHFATAKRHVSAYRRVQQPKGIQGPWVMPW
jgi:L-rhamnose mutarotase